MGIGANQFQLVWPGAMEGFFPEQFDGADGLRAGLAGDLLFGRKQLGGFGVILTELADARVISLFGP